MARERVACTFCNRLIDPEARSSFRRVSGWQAGRAHGGGVALALPERAQVWACLECIDRRRRGHAEQGELL
jgi:hypothetical protein